MLIMDANLLNWNAWKNYQNQQQLYPVCPAYEEWKSKIYCYDIVQVKDISDLAGYPV